MKKTPAEPAQPIKLNIRKAKQESFAEWCKDHKFIQADALGALVDWFMGLDMTTRATVMDLLEKEDQAAVARIALERVIREAGETESVHPDDADIDAVFGPEGAEDDKPSDQEKPDQNDEAPGDTSTGTDPQ